METSKTPKDTLEMGIVERGGRFLFYPVCNDPFALVSKIQDFVAWLNNSVNGQVREDGSSCGECDFKCKGICKAHFAIRFGRNGQFYVKRDNKDFAERCMDALIKIVNDHEALIHASGACQGNHGIS